MDWLCAACRQAKAVRPRDAKLCVPCSWRAVREKSRTLLEALDVPLVDGRQPWESRVNYTPAAPAINDAELLMLIELTRAVGEDPALVLRRVLSGSAKRDTRVYRSEWNRLMARFIGRLEVCWTSAS